ncbi:MAG: TonB family protein [Burkholderiales bacterium]
MAATVPARLTAVPRRATPPKTASDPSAQPALPGVDAVPRAPAPVAAAKRKAAPKAAKPLIVDPELPPPEAPAPGPARRTARIAPAGALPPAIIPKEALVAPRNDRLLGIAIALSVALHVIVLLIHFQPVILKNWNDKGPQIEVALVNAKTVAKPAKADVLAQHNLDGGGNTDEDRRAKTPLPVLPKNNPEQQVAVATQQVEQMERQAKELMTQLKSIPVAPPTQQPTDARDKPDLPTSSELMQKTLEAMRLEAQIAKDMEAYQKRPKRRFIGARAEEYRFARYVEDWRTKIERIGNLNYPEAARQQKLYGNLLITVAIRSDGTLENVEIVRTSGSRILDAAAVRIVEMSAPFAPFPPDIKRDTDILYITRTWMFTKSDSLESK